jgi:hypothetical protein
MKRNLMNIYRKRMRELGKDNENVKNEIEGVKYRTMKNCSVLLSSVCIACFTFIRL